MWPLIAVVSVLAVALIAIIIVFAVRPDPEPLPTDTETPPPTQSSTPSPTADTILVNEADYVNKPYAEVQAALVDLGFGVARVDGPIANTPDKDGRVSGITPVGNLTKGREITVSVYRNYPGPSQPATPSASTSSAIIDEPVTITWTAYAGCPAGYDLSGYTVSLVNARFFSGNGNLGAGTTSVVVQGDAPGTAEVRYTATCGAAGTTPVSGPVAFTVT